MLYDNIYIYIWYMNIYDIRYEILYDRWYDGWFDRWFDMIWYDMIWWDYGGFAFKTERMTLPVWMNLQDALQSRYSITTPFPMHLRLGPTCNQHSLASELLYIQLLPKSAKAKGRPLPVMVLYCYIIKRKSCLSHQVFTSYQWFNARWPHWIVSPSFALSGSLFIFEFWSFFLSFFLCFFLSLSLLYMRGMSPKHLLESNQSY